MDNKRTYRLPDGSCTNKAVAYCDAWQALGKVIGEITGSRAWAYDPDLAFKDDKNFTWNMPAHIAIRIAKAFEEKK